MLAIRSSWLAVFAMAVAVLLCASAGHAKAYPEEVEQQKAMQIINFVCEDGGTAPRSHIWYTTHNDIQRQAPYTWVFNDKYRSNNPNCNPFESTLYELYGDEFNPVTREKMCSDLTDFSRALKNNVVDHKGDIKACCATEDGMEKFFEKKLDDQIANNEKQLEAIDDEERYADEHKGNDNDLKYLNLWTCDKNKSYC
ncbi:hypothetical protein ACIA8C_32670 [Nocardia sp. NPDC051321]|uniref:hypothetical protein n=1 Tax=Nocardia sp. NPDC051321 TaxID=3364323 RepID=UPI0037BA5453